MPLRTCLNNEGDRGFVTYDGDREVVASPRRGDRSTVCGHSAKHSTLSEELCEQYGTEHVLSCVIAIIRVRV